MLENAVLPFKDPSLRFPLDEFSPHVACSTRGATVALLLLPVSIVRTPSEVHYEYRRAPLRIRGAPENAQNDLSIR